MGKKFLIAIVLPLIPLLASMGGSNLLRNGDFEKFSGGEPTGWQTNNIPNMLDVVSQSSRSYSGKSSVKCDVKYLAGTRMAGMIHQKQLEVNGGELQMKGAYLLKSTGKDVGFISVDVKSDEGSTIATCEHYLNESNDSFVTFAFSARLPANAKRIDVLMTLIAEKDATVHEGSSILFDALELTVLAKESKAL